MPKERMQNGERITLAILVLFFAIILIWPLMLLGKVAFDGGLSPFIDAINSRSVLRSLWNSLDSAGWSALLALLMGTITALVLGLTDVRRKGLYIFLLLIPMMIPPHVTAIAWIQALGPSSPLLLTLGIAPEIGSTHPLYSREGVITLLAIQHAPLVLLVVLAGLRVLPREMAEAARTAGARPAHVLARVVLPLMLPSLLAAYALAFVSALGNFGIPALLGIPARYTTLPVLIWRRLASFGPSVLTDMAVIAVIVALLAVLAVVVQMWLAARAHARLTGPPQPPLALALGRARPWVEVGLAAAIFATLILPLTALVTTALVPTYGVKLTAATITLENFAEVIFRQSVTLRAFANSTLIAALSAGILAILAAYVARYATAPQRGLRGVGRAMTLVADMAYAIPGLVISVAFILTFLRPLPLLSVSVYNTLWIILLAYLCAYFAIALKPVTAAFAQLDPTLEEAARVAGANPARRFWHILAPMIAPAAASGAILVFLTAYNEVTVSALLWSGGNETIGTTIFNYEDGGYTTLAAAMAFITVIATVALMMMLDRLGRSAPRGTVPWRL